jgi:hypothetical protein
MRFDLSGESQGEWFRFFRSEIKENGDAVFLDPEEGAGKVCLRIATSDIIEAIQAQTRKKVSEFAHNPKTRAMERVVYFEQTPAQEKKENELIWDHAIVAWEGILDKEGNEIPCTPENKAKIMRASPEFARFVGRCLRLISSANVSTAEGAGKN